MSEITDFAEQFMEEAGGDPTRAKAIAIQRRQDDAALAAKLAPVCWIDAFGRAIDDLWRSGRAYHWRVVKTGGAPSHASVPAMRELRPVLKKGETSTPSAALLRGTQQALTGLMTYQMPNGTLLGHWTKRDLRDLGTQIVEQARGSLRSGYWLLAVSELLKLETDRVCEVLTNADLERLMRQQAS